MEDNLITFGRYKGKPFEILATDKQYIDWLLSQSWFKERHINLYNVVINNFREPVDTPEHNKMQIKFLKQEQRLKLAYKVNPKLFDNNSEKINLAMHQILSTKERNEGEYFLKALLSPSQKDEFGLYSRQLLKFSKPIFERVDVYFSLWYGINFYYDNNHFNRGWVQFKQEICSSYTVEIKPTISDDFPAILRQMKASMPVENSDWQRERFYILLVGKYTGTSATKLEFIEYFETQGYIVVFEDEMENINIPQFEKELKLDAEIQDKIEIARSSETK
jgi:hypothetical protein